VSRKAWKFPEPLGVFSKMRTDFRIFLVCSVGFMLCISAWNILGTPQKAYSQLTMDRQKTRKAGTPLSIATVKRDDRSGIRGPLQTVIRNQDEWKALWKRHSSTDTNPSPAPIVDFNREMVVGIFLGEKRTGGYEVEIVRTERRDSALYFYYREESPRPGAMVTQALTQPFHLVKVAKYQNPQIIFRRDS
jgi:PrcB C-terminal